VTRAERQRAEACGAIKVGRAIVAELRAKAASRAVVNDNLMSVSDALNTYALALEGQVDAMVRGLNDG
jgi:hypothetical protein